MTQFWLALTLVLGAHTSDGARTTSVPECTIASRSCGVMVVATAGAVHHPKPLTVADTVAMLEAIWKAANDGFETRNVRWFYLPDQTATGLTTSESVRKALLARGIPASDRLPVGNDTMVVRIPQWTPEPPDSVRLMVSTWWSYTLGSGERKCRMGSGDTFGMTANRTLLGWTAVKDGRLATGDNVCQRIPTDSRVSITGRQRLRPA